MIAAATRPDAASIASGRYNRARVAAIAVSTIFEWYDFYLCTILASSFAKIFFPLENETASFLSAFTAYAVGFLVRPFGALIIFMGFATFITGLLPTFEQVGWVSPALLVFLRPLQGLALGKTMNLAKTLKLVGFAKGYTPADVVFVSLDVISRRLMNKKSDAVLASETSERGGAMDQRVAGRRVPLMKSDAIWLSTFMGQRGSS